MIELFAARTLPSASAIDLRSHRLFDLLLAVTALVLLAPVMILVAAAIWAESGGPILFRQTRIGQNGRRFVMLKFRKFRPDVGTDGCRLTLDGDPRMTAVGRVLMATKLDELPQLWNVLRGEMAVVGPRPESLAFGDLYQGGFDRVLDYKPGLLGPCQILFRNENALFPAGSDPDEFYRRVLFPAKARIDLAYFQQRTLLRDLQLVMKGVFVVILGATSSKRAEAHLKACGIVTLPRDEAIEAPVRRGTTARQHF